MKNFGLAIKRKRKELDLTQKEVSKLLNVSERTIINWEAGKPIPKTNTKIIENFLMSSSMNILEQIKESPYFKEMDLLEKIDFILKEVQSIKTILEDQNSRIDENALKAWKQNAELQEMVIFEGKKIKLKKDKNKKLG